MDYLEIVVAIVGVVVLVFIVYDIIFNTVTDKDMEGY